MHTIFASRLRNYKKERRTLLFDLKVVDALESEAKVGIEILVAENPPGGDGMIKKISGKGSVIEEIRIPLFQSHPMLPHSLIKIRSI